MTGSQSVPFTAWEQAVFVALFFVLVVVILAWTSRQQEKTQDFIDRLNHNWQEFLTQHETKNDQALAQVVTALNCLTEKLAIHDDHVDQRVKEIKDAAILEASVKDRSRGKAS